MLTGSNAIEVRKKEDNNVKEDNTPSTILSIMESEDGVPLDSSLNIPLDITADQLTIILNQLLSNKEKLNYSFFINDTEIVNSIRQDIKEISTESNLNFYLVFIN